MQNPVRLQAIKIPFSFVFIYILALFARFRVARTTELRPGLHLCNHRLDHRDFALLRAFCAQNWVHFEFVLSSFLRLLLMLNDLLSLFPRFLYFSPFPPSLRGKAVEGERSQEGLLLQGDTYAVKVLPPWGEVGESSEPSEGFLSVVPRNL